MTDKDKDYLFSAYHEFMIDLWKNTEASEQEIIEKLIDFLIG